MKKSFLSFLLGVAVIASTSVFVSCQDYQDEFKALQDQFDAEHPALNNKVAALETEIQNLEATVAALQSQHDKDVAALQAADDQLKDLLADEMVKANAYALAQAEKALADAKAYADAKAAEKAEEALKSAQAYADKIAAAEAQKEAAAALVAANEQSQALYLDAISQLNKAVETINAQAAAEKSERQAADAALEAGYKAADAEIWTALNKAQKDIEAAQAAADKAQATADEALKLAKANATAIENEIKRAKDAEAELTAALETEAARAKAEEAKLWEAIAEANAKIAAETEARIAADKELNTKIEGALDRIKTLENKVATLQEEMKAAQDKLNEHQTRIEALEAWTAAYEPIIKDLQGRMTTAETKIADLYTKLAAEEAARIAADDAEKADRIAADEDLQKQVTANAEAIAKEVADRAAAVKDLQEQIDANKKAIAANADAIKALQDECAKINKAIADEVAARIQADGTEAAAREAADKVLEQAIKDAAAKLQSQIDELVKNVKDLDEAIKALDTKVEGYNTTLTEAIAAANAKISALSYNPFQVIDEIDFQAANRPSHAYKYYQKFDITVAGQNFKENERIVTGSYVQTPGKVYVLLAPQNNNFTGHQLYVLDERNAALPGYTFGTFKKVDAADTTAYFNNAATPYVVYTRGDAVTGPIWAADVTTAEPSEKAKLNNIAAPHYVADKTYNQAFTVVGEYTQKNDTLGDTKMLVWDENFDFKFAEDYDAFKATLATITVAPTFEAANTERVMNLTFTGENDTLIYKQAITCVKAYDRCGNEDAAAVAYMNGSTISTLMNKPLDDGALTNGITAEVEKKYDFFTFEYLYEAWNLNGTKVANITKKLTFGPTITPASQSYHFDLEPAAGTSPQWSAELPIVDKAHTLWNIDQLPADACIKLTATLKAVNPVANNGVVTVVIPGSGLMWDLYANTNGSDDYSAADTAAMNSFKMAYNPALLSLYNTYEYELVIKYGEILIATNTITFDLVRPACHKIELTPITSAWNKAKTKTIVWAAKGGSKDATKKFWKARYWMTGSYTDIEDYNTPEADGCKLAFRDSTDYTGCDSLKVITLPAPTDWRIVVPSYAVKNNTGLDQPSFDFLQCWYDLNYGTEIFGLQNLYGDSVNFQIAFCSPIYYDGVTYDWEAGQYKGGCSLPTKPYIIEFPNKETTIKSADFVGSNDPSTSVVDPIVYFGPSRDERILDVTVAMGDASEIAATYPDYYVWNDPTNMYLFEVAPEVTDAGIYFKTYDKTPSLQSIPAFYYNLVVTDVWGCVKTYPFVISVNPNTPMN